MNRRLFSVLLKKPFHIAGMLVVCSCLAGLLFSATGCSRSAPASTEAVEKTPETVEVRTAPPHRSDLTRDIVQPGFLLPYEQTPIYTKIAGFAEEPRYDIGDHVKKGELLLKLYVPEVVQELRVKAAKVKQAEADLKEAREAALAAKASVEAARAEIDAKSAAISRAKAEVERWKAEDVRSRKLVGGGVYDQQTADEVINQLRASEAVRDEAEAKYMWAKATYQQASANYEKAEAKIEVASANVAVAQADHDQWRDWLSYAQITSPYDGIVTLLNVHTGHFLQPVNSGSTSKAAEPLFMVMRTDIMRCTVEVPELDAVLVREHDKALVHLQAKPGSSFSDKDTQDIEGEVTRFSYALDEHSRTLKVEIHLRNPDGRLLPNMYANVTIHAKIHNAWILPEEAVMNDILDNGNRNYCFVVEDGKAHKAFLNVGAHCNEGVQILGIQRPGGKMEKITGTEAVVITNPKALQDGQPVKLQATTEQPVASGTSATQHAVTN